VPGLARLVEHRDRGVRESALEALGRFADRHAREGLHRGLVHADPATRIAAAAALGGRGVAGLRPLLDALEREPDAAVRATLVLSAARTGAPQAGRALAVMLLRRRTLLRRRGWPDAARVTLVRALAEAGGAVGAEVVRAVAREGEGEVAAAARAAAAVLGPDPTSS
jgi:HEAT repeat protein